MNTSWVSSSARASLPTRRRADCSTRGLNFRNSPWNAPWWAACQRSMTATSGSTAAPLPAAAPPAALAPWLRDIGPPLAIPEADWPGIKVDWTEAVRRWARHIADPDDIETYVHLSRHTRHGFIGQFPASRFIAAQMRFTQLLAEELLREYAHDRP